MTSPVAGSASSTCQNSASALVFGQLFFPDRDPLSGTLLVFSTCAVGYVSRQLGGFVFGRLGDTLGRKRVLVITLLVTGISTVLIGPLPTYGQVRLVTLEGLALSPLAGRAGSR